MTDMASRIDFWITPESPPACSCYRDPRKLSKAAYCGKSRAVQGLLDQGEDPNASIWQDRSPLEYVVCVGRLELI